MWKLLNVSQKWRKSDPAVLCHKETEAKKEQQLAVLGTILIKLASNLGISIPFSQQFSL